MKMSREVQEVEKCIARLPRLVGLLPVPSLPRRVLPSILTVGFAFELVTPLKTNISPET